MSTIYVERHRQALEERLERLRKRIAQLHVDPRRAPALRAAEIEASTLRERSRHYAKNDRTRYRPLKQRLYIYDVPGLPAPAL